MTLYWINAAVRYPNGWRHDRWYRVGTDVNDACRELRNFVGRPVVIIWAQAAP